MNDFWLAIGAIILIAVCYEVYRPLGISLAVIAITTMILKGGLL